MPHLGPGEGMRTLKDMGSMSFPCPMGDRLVLTVMMKIKDVSQVPLGRTCWHYLCLVGEETAKVLN